jgi:pyridoxal phosphate enzyme (YggS family)
MDSGIELMINQRYIRNLNKLFDNIEKARVIYSPHHIVKVVAVSKYSTSDEIRAMYEAGQRAFGENKVQDLLKKQKELADLPIQWHFIGRLQTNKINQLIDANVALLHSIDSLKTAQELDKRLKTKNKKLNALLQINSSFESTKAGVSPSEAIDVYQKIIDLCTNINLGGIMSIGAHSADTSRVKDSFYKTKFIYDGIKNASILSMGMSNDYEEAIKLGSNMIRIGSSIFK